MVLVRKIIEFFRSHFSMMALAALAHMQREVSQHFLKLLILSGGSLAILSRADFMLRSFWKLDFFCSCFFHSHQDPTRASKSRKREILVSFIHSYPFSAPILPVVSLSRAHSTTVRSDRCDTHFHSITRQQQRRNDNDNDVDDRMTMSK